MQVDLILSDMASCNEHQPTASQPPELVALAEEKLNSYVEKCKDDFLDELGFYVSDSWMNFETEWYLAVIHLDTYLEQSLDQIVENSIISKKIRDRVAFGVWHIEDANPESIVQECYFRIESKANWRIELIERAGNYLAKQHLLEEVVYGTDLSARDLVRWSDYKGCLVFSYPMECVLVEGSMNG